METWISALGIFLFGLVIGSFLNVVIYRFNTSRSLGGRSKCVSCNKKLSWHELIPLASWLLARGRCRTCKAKISPQYPIVELCSGLVFLLVFLKFQHLAIFSLPAFLGTLAFHFFAWSVLAVILVYDVRHSIIPNRLAYLFAGLAFLQFFVPGLGAADYSLLLPHLLSGPLLALPLAALWLFSKGRLIGLGDAKLALGVGFLLGFSGGLAAILIAFWSGAIVSLVLMAASRGSVRMKTEIPFAPFIIFGLAAVFFLGLTLQDIVSFFTLPFA